jgi:phospholipase/carboxylesterase
MLKYESEIIGENPQKLVVFLHGYNGNINDHAYAINWIKQYLENAVFCVPLAPETCDKNPKKKQWFGMLKYDAENARAKPETPTEKIFAIYNAAATEISANAGRLNNFISAMQKQFGFGDSQTYLAGFSQGAMLTIYTALTRDAPLAGGFVLSGLVAGEKLLAQSIKSRPPLYLFHGKDDLKVQYKTLAATQKWLQSRQITVQTQTYAGLAHRMNEAEMQKVAQIINNRA